VLLRGLCVGVTAAARRRYKQNLGRIIEHLQQLPTTEGVPKTAVLVLT
jgi:hypothetical protein